MDSPKESVRRPRVVHGPHRIRVSGVAVVGTEQPVENLLPSEEVVTSELVGTVIDVPQELASIEEQPIQTS